MGYIGAGISRFNTADELTVSGDATIDTTTLVVDSTNNRVGIGTASPATALDVTGTVTADGLTVDSTVSTFNGTTVNIDLMESDTTDVNTRIRQSGSGLSIQTINDAASSATNRMRIDHLTGDISFRADDGTTDALFFDASTQRLGLGTSSPTKVLHLETSGETVQRMVASTTNLAGFYFGDSGNGSIGQLIYDNSSDSMRFNTNGGERVRITSGGSVGINTSAPTEDLHIKGKDGAHADVIIQAYTGYNSGLNFNDNAGMAGRVYYNHSSNFMAFDTNGSEAVRIDSSQNLLVGTTDSTPIGSGGISLRNDGRIDVSRDGGIAANFDRRTSDGDIVQFLQSGATVGAIGSRDGFVTIYNGDTGLGFDAGSDHIRPISSAGSRDNAIDLGRSATRFDDIYATNGSIQTSDQNEKQQIASLTDAEITAAKSISALFKTFKWNDKVEAKGDDARTHTGVIAQEVQTAMSNAGLDAANYAFWCSNTWWETSTEVPAVEADEEAGIEAADAYTRIDTYETADEAPDGATQRTRMGIRYPELLAFVGAATEQRLADIETRLAALEAN